MQITWPASGRAVWQVFCDLNNTRPQGMGASGITYQEIDAYTRLHQLQLTPWELQMIQTFDRLAIEAAA